MSENCDLCEESPAEHSVNITFSVPVAELNENGSRGKMLKHLHGDVNEDIDTVCDDCKAALEYDDFVNL
jgi:hypothetical protein